MQFLNLTLAQTSENLALDEALLERAESSLNEKQPAELDLEIARIWRPQQTAVILGRGSKYQEEVDLEFCQQNGIPILRRHSGGASVVIGPGSFLYSVVISFSLRPELRDLTLAHQFVMSRVRQSLLKFVPGLEIQGVCDLTYQSKKVSGNSLKVARHHFMYHGTILYQFDLERLARCLLTPPRQPEYRQGRPHSDFVANLPVLDPALFEEQFPAEFQRAWGTDSELQAWPETETGKLATEKYSTDDWNFRR